MNLDAGSIIKHRETKSFAVSEIFTQESSGWNLYSPETITSGNEPARRKYVITPIARISTGLPCLADEGKGGHANGKLDVHFNDRTKSEENYK